MSNPDHDVHEFQTQSGASSKNIVQRSKPRLIGSAVDDPRNTPKFRPFDLLRGPNERLTIWRNGLMRMGVESLGAHENFRRNVNFDEVWFQFAGTTRVESEYGILDVTPGELVLMPAGVAHRCQGTSNSVRLFSEIKEIVDFNLGHDQLKSHSEFDMARTGGPSWDDADVEAGCDPATDVMETMICWEDDPEGPPNLFRRQYGDLVGNSSGGRGVQKTRAFDYFAEITGTSGPGPVIFKSPRTMVEAYNTEGEQHGFHRALGSDEMWLQFRGDSTNESEYGVYHLEPGEMSHVPPGIAHRVVGSEGFLRLVVYSWEPWEMAIDPAMDHPFASSFDAKETVIEAPAFRLEAAKV